ncbi:hypothetical protein J41TS12_50110 [Paenibacillus antibioticophila]|uniref:YtkA-like domain-containing protein n=1 Tax=Paenibacillus antibioticophila TaxID=1274374 RepID=A0A920CHZ5_9BACL|nr:FixH family protein [Paenibacillus antibioticophila]GIO40150.1 hypothetical protein J41TS12_50110 [Paenibacillus antibioticophila]
MKNKGPSLAVLLILISVLLSACSLRTDAAELYKQEQPLEAAIVIPELLLKDEPQTIKVVLTQGGQPVQQADYVHIDLWKQDGTIKFSMEEAVQDGNGVYHLNTSFDSDGLYYIKVYASSQGSIIMPRKQFVVGGLSESELEAIRKNQPEEIEGHHHHH